MKLVIFLYFCISCLLSVKFVLSNQKERRVISIIIAFWFFNALIFKSRYFPSFNPLPFKIRPFYYLAFLFLFLLPASFSNKLTAESVKPVKYFVYEKYLFLYFIFNQITVVINHYYLGTIGPDEFNYVTYVHITAFVLYLYFSRNMNIGLLKTLMQVITVIALITSLVAVVQFFYDRTFFRMAGYSQAYGSFYRATGIFPTGYDHGLHLIVAIFVAHYTLKNHFIRMSLIILYCIAIFVLLSRGMYLALFVTGVYYLLSIAKSKINLVVLALLVSLFLLWGAFDTYDLGHKLITSKYGGIYQERLMSDTATPRLHYYEFVIKAIPQKFLIGFGSRKNNEVYRRGMIDADHVGWADGTKGGIHNMVLEIAFLRGIVVAYVFVAFFVYLLKFIKEYYRINGSKFVVVIGCAHVSFFVYRMTTASFIRSYCGMLIMLYTGIITGIYYNNIKTDKLYRKL